MSNPTLSPFWNNFFHPPLSPFFAKVFPFFSFLSEIGGVRVLPFGAAVLSSISAFLLLVYDDVTVDSFSGQRL